MPKEKAKVIKIILALQGNLCEKADKKSKKSFKKRFKARFKAHFKARHKKSMLFFNSTLGLLASAPSNSNLSSWDYNEDI